MHASTHPLDPDQDAPSAVRLTQQVKAGGCASKLAPGTLAQVLGRLPKQQHADLLVSFDTSDDAGVFRLSTEQALVQTVDFFTPMVDDPFTYGCIAATNALSDVYAMGGRALTALCVLCYPQDGDQEVLGAILRGGLSTMEQADCLVVGGHSVRDSEIKFGYSVTGVVHPERVLTNTGARAGDALVFTKAIGTGVITTALKQGKSETSWVEAAVASMTHLNKAAANVITRPEFEVHAATDVTGFGLLGHARELAFGSNVALEIDSPCVPVLHGAYEAIERGCIPAGLLANRDFAGCVVKSESRPAVPAALRDLLYDPQTAGGLLLSLPEARADDLVSALHIAGYGYATRIGRVHPGKPGILLL